MNVVFKKNLINVLKFFNNKPVFNRLFFWIHEIRSEDNPNTFVARLLPEGFMFGTFDNRNSGLWKRIVHRGFEKEEMELIKNNIQPCDAFIDIGAHIGYYTCLVKKLKPSLTIMAFEPNPENYKSLRANCGINTIPQEFILNEGLGNKKEKLIMYGRDSAGTVNRECHVIEPKEKYEVTINTLSSYIEAFKSFKSVFIKIDVESFEYNVLLGAKDFFATVKPAAVLMEVNKFWSSGKNPNFEKTFALMKDYGYVIQNVEMKSGSLNASDLTGGNYLFKRRG